MKSMKTLALLTLSLTLAFSLTACGGTPKPAQSPSADQSTGKGIKVAIVTSSGVDDGSFGEDCYKGTQDFLADHPDSSVTAIKEPDLNKTIQSATDILGDYDVLVLPGFQFAGIGVAMKENPDKKVILVDAAPVDADGKETSLDNVYSMSFAEQESGFFAGVAAAMETKTGKVAVVNGIAYPSNVNYQFGFESGVSYAVAHYGAKAECVAMPSYAGTDVTGANVGGNYVGAFEDEATGKVVGNALIEKGCDILFVAAGASGNGVFTAAKEADNVYVIGCDVDQYDDGSNGTSNIILTSALKNMHSNVQKQLTAIYDGTFKGENAILTASSNSTGYVSAEGRQQLSAATLEKLSAAYELLKSGTIVPAAAFNGFTSSDFPGLK